MHTKGIIRPRLQSACNVLLILTAAAILFMAAFIASSALKVQDLAEYWSAAHLIRENPYSQPLVTSFERSAGYSLDSPAMVIRNPPYALFFILPFRYMNYNVAFAMWTLVSLLIVAACARVSANMYGNEESSLAPAFLCLLFGPTVVLLMLGQIVVLDLLGVTLFLVLVQRKRDWLAGSSLFLTCVKPHIVLLFLIVAMLWSAKFRRWAVPAAIALSLLATTLVSLLLNPHILVQYSEFARQFARETMPYPNIGGLLYLLSGHRTLAFLPQLAGLAWLVFYWHRHAADWDWSNHGMVALLVSMTCSYYSFPFDQVVVLPALITAFVRGNRRIFLTGFILTNLGFALHISNFAGKLGFGYMFLWWTAAAWLVTYAAAMKLHSFTSATIERNVVGT